MYKNREWVGFGPEAMVCNLCSRVAFILFWTATHRVKCIMHLDVHVCTTPKQRVYFFKEQLLLACVVYDGISPAVSVAIELSFKWDLKPSSAMS